ncbi:DUF3300 domain-containing protein [Cupriavidus sp.]|uniref:DUF3300 domain-containing protein n=1 Tax=Cupriavidus sp. TaxID=1873897 RepID=UPI0025C4DFC1|nr:DUF3300 domain-containing protein [Cupriavidus sp.]MCA3182014.1 DUF3300 domain-containing protein [Cupriavidus sp.]MCA3188760.1 DUF3300 domain-containing protein [Cupriavidus sp.]MCA3198480.1 DUF3300 domain-containing protein [Cupriavidus sp.]MCA3201226.1 DUF3300 domain-containing protein [Cupriavidus sp.]MCA3210431.1 DUF3300 domain-containing protein [Cupriavidus sp.]
MLRVRQILAWLLGLTLLATAGGAMAQAKLDPPHLDQLLAPVALYPDALLSQVLMASTYPADVAAAAQWSKSNQSLSGDAATKAVAGEPWDPSVQSLVAFPSVMDMMGRQPQWVQSVGDAFLAQPDDVMDSVQRLRVQAQKAGTLKTTEQQKVVTQQTGGTTIVQIEPANPQVVYVPAYNPTVVYGTWPYPAYPPAYYPPPPGSVFATSLVAGIGFGLGVAAVNSMWGGFNWGGHDVNINVNRYNNINVNQRLDVNRANVNWQHNPANRGNVPYNNPNVANRFDAQRQQALANRPPPGQAGGQRLGQGGGGVQNPQRPGGAQNQRDAARDRAAQSFQGRTGQSIQGHGSPGVNRQGGGQNPRPAGASRQRADQTEARNRARDSNHANAFHDAGNGDRMRQQTERGGSGLQRAGGGQAPQRAMPERGGGGFHGGGNAGGGHFGGGGGAGGAHFGHGRR